nr:E3 ubiquitin-protein ligase UPL7 isoform X1 [Ipomoea trifida]
MDEPRKHQVSLRGASVKEISRDALLEKVSHQRELRSYIRKSTAAAVFIQRVWRRYSATKLIALQLQNQWEILMDNLAVPLTKIQISGSILRPFIFFMSFLLNRGAKKQKSDKDCMKTCFRVVLESINSTNLDENFCSMAFGNVEERRVWTYQSKKLISLCLLVLAEFDNSRLGGEDIFVTSLALRLAVVLTDLKGWKCIINANIQAANISIRDLVHFMGSKKSCLYSSVRRYICKLQTPVSSQVTSSGQADDRFLIIASATTLALRPFHVAGLVVNTNCLEEVQNAAEQFCIFLLTIPWFAQKLPAVLIPALRHMSVLSACLRVLLMSREGILKEMSCAVKMTTTHQNRVMPQVGWALANIIYLATMCEKNALDSGKFAPGLDHASYVHVVIALAENLLTWLEKVGWLRKDQEVLDDCHTSAESLDNFLHEAETTAGSLKMSYLDLLKPVCQQGHLMKLVSFNKDTFVKKDDNLPAISMESPRCCELLDVAYYYSCMLRIYSALNTVHGAFPVLNMLSFTPGFLSNLWGALEKNLFPGKDYVAESASNQNKVGESNFHEVSAGKQKHFAKDSGSKWVDVIQKITGKSQTESKTANMADGISGSNSIDEHCSDIWDIEPLRKGPDGISKDTNCLLHLFCASYSHLLLVLDDIEFYERQVPFVLEQQRKIASVLNTLVYNALSLNIGAQNRPLMDFAVKCLHLLYERDCRHQFCPPALWLSPGRINRPPIAVAARTHEVLAATTNDVSASLTIDSVITTTPHVFPFEERVEMFREFINMDKVSRRMAGEVVGPGPHSVEIVIRRGHVFEDGFQQINSLGSRLKSNIHVSFVNESGLPEAGLDYGGLSKEFLTEIAKAAFSPECGLFIQTSTSDRLLIPNSAARFLENGFQMIEFLGKIVGKALYEGILLDYSFSHVFVQKLLGRYSFLDELSTLDPVLYRNLMYVKHYEGDVRELSLDFTVTEESLGKRHVIELKPGGKDASVTNDNKLQYIYAIADYKLNRQILPFSNAFYRGLTEVISPSWLKLFNASEFNQLLSGGNHDIDVDDLRKNTRYTGGYSESSRAVKLFWEVFANFEARERCLLLKFVTSCSRAPLLGFKYLQPTFTIHKVSCDVPLLAVLGGQDVDRLPSASTCYNTLKLPTYKRSSTLRAKLIYAINSNAGFELS